MIHVVEGGCIVESGRHESLLRAGARYADFYYSQFGNDAAAISAEPRLSANS
jgi:ABC-type multidrug transport system fused ATPase/permease subunit